MHTPSQSMPNTKKCYEVTKSELPLHCPLPDMPLWNSHPRVYLPIQDNHGQAKCPYCGTDFVLKNNSHQ